MTDSHHVVFTCTVRYPRDSDGFKEIDGEYYTEDEEVIYAVVDLGNGYIVPFLDQYVDWYGDGGLEPSLVAGALFYRALGGK